MLVVKVELHSAIDGTITEIGRMVISNDGTSARSDRGNYNVRLMRRDSPEVVCKRGRVEQHPRKSASVWLLVKRALAAVIK